MGNRQNRFGLEWSGIFVEIYSCGSEISMNATFGGLLSGGL